MLPMMTGCIAIDVMRSCAAAGKLPARIGPQAAGSWRTLQRPTRVSVVAAKLTGCARGRGIGLEAMMAGSQLRIGGISAWNTAVCRIAAGSWRAETVANANLIRSSELQERYFARSGAVAQIPARCGSRDAHAIH
jgi:hypothetical protein